MELMIAVILISTIAAFAIPSYRKAIRKGYERNAILHLKTIHGANEIYRARAGEYVPGAGLNLAGINAALSINIIDTDTTYFYTRVDADNWAATATWTGAVPFTLSIDEDPVTALNPCCSVAGTCQIVPDC